MMDIARGADQFLDYYYKLGFEVEESNMSVDSTSDSGAFPTTNFGRMSIDNNSSIGSNNTHALLSHQALQSITAACSYSVVGSGVSKISHALSDDSLAQALMDIRYSTEGLKDYEDWTLDLRRLNMGRSRAFARGSFGKLCRGTYSGLDVAIKLLEMPENNDQQRVLMEQQFVKEVMMLSGLCHPNVVRFVGDCVKPGVWCIVTEYAKGGSVRQFLSRNKSGMPLKLVVKQALDVARGMEYVHGLGFIHRDLKSDNLLISSDKSIKIADFGFARIEVQTEGMTPQIGTYRWMAPEMIQHRAYNQKVDVYSFGIVLWELITGMLPFATMSPVQAAFAVVNKGIRPIVPSDCIPTLRDIITSCWDTNPDVRPSFTEVIKMLEGVQSEILNTVRRARFRCCLSRPMTID